MDRRTLSAVFTGVGLFLALLAVTPAEVVGEPLRVAMGGHLPPYVIPERDTGITIEILNRTLKPAGYEVIPRYYPYARRIVEYEQGNADAVIDIVETDLPGHLSVPAITYENVAVALRKNRFDIDSIEDLSRFSVISWQGAAKVLGPEYATMAEANPRYREVPDQRKQVMLLFSDRIDVAQLDRSIFQYYRNRLRKTSQVDPTPPVEIYPLFGEITYRILFRDEAARDAFDRNFKAMRESGAVAEIRKRFIEGDN